MVERHADHLLERARVAHASAYAPYSGFRVGAAVEMEDGRVFTGANVENASYGLSICAERVAIVTAVAAGGRRIGAVAVVADAESAAPCGACRQFIAEFADEATVVHYPDRGGTVTTPLVDLLPAAFSLGG